MSIRAPRRQTAHQLADMTDRELLEIRYFGNLIGENGTPCFRATEAQKREAVEILQSRGVTDLPQRPDPRPVLSGRTEDRERIAAAQDEFTARRDALLRDAAT